MRNFQSKGSQLKSEKQNPAIKMLLKQKEITRCLAWEDRTRGLLAGLQPRGCNAHRSLLLSSPQPTLKRRQRDAVQPRRQSPKLLEVQLPWLRFHTRVLFRRSQKDLCADDQQVRKRSHRSIPDRVHRGQKRIAQAP